MKISLRIQNTRTAINKHTIFLLIFLLTLSNIANAKEFCTLVNNSSVIKNKNLTQNIQFDKQKLLCSEFSVFETAKGNWLAKEELHIIRGHKNELKNSKVLASRSGYHLIQGKINCQKQHCDHFASINIAAFNPIEYFDSSKTNTLHLRSTQGVVDLLDSNAWRTTIISLSSWNRQSGSTGNNSASSWIDNQMQALELQVSTPSFTVSGQMTKNIIGVKTGLTRPNDWYIVGGHMDSIPSSGNAPGAIDNASGCAGVLEIARVASQFSFAGTLLFICYSGEEQGLIGSQHHVTSLIAAGDQDKVKAALTLDMIGYTNDSTTHELLLESSASNQWLIDLLAENANNYAPNLTILTSTNPFGSDHVPYINNNMHGILSIDNDWSVYPAYHQSNDLPENINLIQGEYILKTNIAALVQLATLLGPSDLIFINSFD